jgi:hypothetical protein
LYFYLARPLGSNSVRYIPAYYNSSWHNLYIVKLGSHYLAGMAPLDRPFSSLEKKVENFRAALITSRLEIPYEVHAQF